MIVLSVVQCMQDEYIFDDCCYYICMSFSSFTHVAGTLLVQEFNSTHSRMRSSLAKHIVQTKFEKGASDRNSLPGGGTTGSRDPRRALLFQYKLP